MTRRTAVLGWLVGAGLSGCLRDPTRASDRRPVEFTAAWQPTLAELEAEAARLRRCVVPAAAPGGAWVAHPLPGLGGSVRLPPSYAALTAERDPAPPATWVGADSGVVSVMVTDGLGGTFLVQPDGAAAYVGESRCALPMFGRLAQVRRVAAVLGGGRDTVHIVTVDAPVDARRMVGAGAMHHRAGARDTLLAALATMRLGP